MRLYFFASIFLIFIYSSCGNQPEEVAIINLEVPLELPAGLNSLETHVFQVFGVPTFFDERLAASGVSEDQISIIQSGLGSFNSNFSNVDLDFILGITVHVLLDGATGPRRELFYLEQTQLNVDSEIELLASASDLKEIINKKDLDLEFNFRLRAFCPQTFTGLFDLNLGVYID